MHGMYLASTRFSTENFRVNFQPEKRVSNNAATPARRNESRPRKTHRAESGGARRGERALLRRGERALLRRGEHALLARGEHALLARGEHAPLARGEHALLVEALMAAITTVIMRLVCTADHVRQNQNRLLPSSLYGPVTAHIFVVSLIYRIAINRPVSDRPVSNHLVTHGSVRTTDIQGHPNPIPLSLNVQCIFN